MGGHGDLDLPDDSLGPGLPLSPQVSYVTLMSLNNEKKAPQVKVLHIWPRQTAGWRAGGGPGSSTLMMLSYA